MIKLWKWWWWYRMIKDDDDCNDAGQKRILEPTEARLQVKPENLATVFQKKEIQYIITPPTPLSNTLHNALDIWAHVYRNYFHMMQLLTSLNVLDRYTPYIWKFTVRKPLFVMLEYVSLPIKRFGGKSKEHLFCIWQYSVEVNGADYRAKHWKRAK